MARLFGLPQQQPGHEPECRHARQQHAPQHGAARGDAAAGGRSGHERAVAVCGLAASDVGPGYIGQRPRNTPKLTFNLWSTYALGGGWKIGGGVEATSDRYAYVPTAANASSNFSDGKFSPNTAPGYARWEIW